MPLFETYIVVDWSARSKPSPVAATKDAIFWAVAHDGREASVHYARTRHEAVSQLKARLEAERAVGRRVLVGFDFPFGYPQGVAETLTGSPSAFALWDWLADRIEDGPDNANNRFEVAETINRHYSGCGPMWGRPAEWHHPDVPTTQSERHGDHPSEQRLADRRADGAKTVWQMAYAGSVGSQVLMGLPVLKDLRDSLGAQVWPFDTGLTAPDAPLVLAEVYPSLLQAEAHADCAEDEPLDAAQVRVTARALAALDRQEALAPLFDVSVSEAERHVVETEEAMILGVGHEAALKAALIRSRPTARPYERDPAAIYNQSFATVRREARLDRFSAAMQPVVTRLIHSCGMVEIADRLAFSPNAREEGSKALRLGAPILCDCEMVGAGIIRRYLPAQNDVIVTLNDPSVPALAKDIDNTRSAAAVELWRDDLDGAVVAIGNAPTALFHLLELLDQGWPKPAVILGFPVGFVGAAESKADLAAHPRGCDFIALRGRRGGSAMASAAVNALAAGLPEDRG